MQAKSPVTDIFNQLTAGPQARLKFPHDPQKKATFLTLAAHVHREVRRQAELDPVMEMKLVLQLARHCVSYDYLRPEKTAEFIQAVPDLVEALAEKPERLLQQPSIRSIMNTHAQHKAQKTADLRRRFMQANSDNFRVSTLWESMDGYCLVELHTPAHLKAETLILNHCIGLRHNLAAIAQKGISAGGAEEDNYLQYAIRMRRGESRIFSLRAPDGLPVATMCYDNKSRSITELEGAEPYIKRSNSHFTALCRALSALEQILPVGKIHNLPPLLSSNEYCTRDGVFATGNGRVPKDMLFGTITVDKNTSTSDLHALARNPRLTLNISHLADTKRLPVHVKADLVLTAGPGNSADLSHIETAADILSECCEMDLSSLRSCHDLHMPWVHKLRLPRLAQSGSVVSGCTSIYAPLLRQCGNLSLPHLRGRTQIPQLKRALNLEIGVHSEQLGELDLPQLRHCLIFACSARHLKAPLLEYADELDLKNATQATLGELVAIGDIRAAYLRSLHVPELITAAHIDIGRCQVLTARKLTFAHEIFVHHQAVIITPLLESGVPINYEGRDYTLSRRKGPGWD